MVDGRRIVILLANHNRSWLLVSSVDGVGLLIDGRASSAGLHNVYDVVTDPFLVHQDYVVDVRLQRYAIGMNVSNDHRIAYTASCHIDDF